MTRIERIDADLFGFIRDDPRPSASSAFNWRVLCREHPYLSWRTRMTRTRSIVDIAGMQGVGLAAALGAMTVVRGREPPRPVNPAPNRGPDEGRGPYKVLVIRAGMRRDVTGAPPEGAVDIVIQHDRIKDV